MHNLYGTRSQAQNQALVVDQNYAHGTFFMAMSTLESLVKRLSGQNGPKLFGAYDHYDYSSKETWDLVNQLITQVQLLDVSTISFGETYGRDTYIWPKNFELKRALNILNEYRASLQKGKDLPNRQQFEYCFSLANDITNIIQKRGNDLNYKKMNVPKQDRKNQLGANHFVKPITIMHDVGDQIRSKGPNFKAEQLLFRQNHGKQAGQKIFEQKDLVCLEAYVYLQNKLQKIKCSQYGVFSLLFSSEIKSQQIKELAQGIYPQCPNHLITKPEKGKFKQFVDFQLRYATSIIFIEDLKQLFELKQSGSTFNFNASIQSQMKRLLTLQTKDRRITILARCEDSKVIQQLGLQEFSVIRVTNNIGPDEARILKQKGMPLSKEQEQGQLPVSPAAILKFIENAAK